MTNAIVPRTEQTALEVAGQVANAYAADAVFSDFTARKSDNTLRAHRADLDTFAVYLAAAGVTVDGAQLQTTPGAWRGVTWGIVAGFQRWALAAGYSIASINRKLSTVRTYAKLASKGGAIGAQELVLIRAVSGYGGKEGKRTDEKRAASGTPTRTGRKKAQHVAISAEQAKMLKAQPDTPQGRRDALIMALLLDHGLRVGELALLTVGSFDLKAGTFTFYRPKVGRTQTHRLTADSLAAVRAYIDAGDAPPFNDAPILRGSDKGGRLTHAGMSERSITMRVRALGAAVGLTGLSAHDCRHSWATRAAVAGTDGFALRDAGGWSSMAMPGRYVAAAEIANERVRLD